MVGWRNKRLMVSFLTMFAIIVLLVKGFSNTFVVSEVSSTMQLSLLLDKSI